MGTTDEASNLLKQYSAGNKYSKTADVSDKSGG